MDDSCIAGARCAQLPEFSLASPRAKRILSAWLMIELEVYATAVRQLEKILALARKFTAIRGWPHKVDRNHDLVYMEFEEPRRAILATFAKLNLDPRFAGRTPAGWRSKPTTQPLSS
jgi:hypothetical protein